MKNRSRKSKQDQNIPSKDNEGRKKKDAQSTPTEPWISKGTGFRLIIFLSIGMTVLTGIQTIPSLGFEGLLWSLFFGGMIWVIFYGMQLFYRILR